MKKCDPASPPLKEGFGLGQGLGRGIFQRFKDVTNVKKARLCGDASKTVRDRYGLSVGCSEPSLGLLHSGCGQTKQATLDLTKKCGMILFENHTNLSVTRVVVLKELVGWRVWIG